MKRPWKALGALAATAAVVLGLSTSASAIGGKSTSAPQWKTSLGQASWSGRLTALYPGAASDTESFPVTVRNGGRAKQSLTSLTAAMVKTTRGDAETAGGADITGCRAGWFAVGMDPRDRRLPASIAPGASYTGTVDLSMRDSGSNQEACRSARPAFTVTAG